MAAGTEKLSLQKRTSLRLALLSRHKSLASCIYAIAEGRLGDSGAAVTPELLENVGTQLRRILRPNNKDSRNGVISANWKEDLTKVSDDAGKLLLVSPSKRAKSKKLKSPDMDRPKNLSGRLLKDIADLHVGREALQCAMSVLTHRDYPRMMSVGGSLVRNPIWNDISEQRWAQLRKDYEPSGPTPPKVMRLDMLLIRRDNDWGQGALYTYFSPDWQTHLIHFRQWLPEDDADRRHQLNSSKLSRHWGLPPEKIKVAQIPGKFCVSVKPHPKYGDLILYFFEFCSICFHGVSDQLKALYEMDPDHSNKALWRDMRHLRSDPASSAVNGDVVRSIHEFFSVSLDRLPHSFPSLKEIANIQKKRQNTG